MSVIQVNGHTYKVGKMNALAQFHVSRRLAPVMAAMGMSLSQLKGDGDGPPDLGDFTQVVGPATEVIAKMSNQDADFIIFTCLQVVSRDQGSERFAPISAGQNLMFEDIDMLVMLRLVVEVLIENLWNFLPGPDGAPPSPGS